MYVVTQQTPKGGDTVYSVWLGPWVRQVSVKPLTHDEAVVLCERLNRDVSKRTPKDPISVALTGALVVMFFAWVPAMISVMS